MTWKTNNRNNTTMMYKIDSVSGNMLHRIIAYTNCVPLKSELLLKQRTFLRNRCN